MSDKVNVIVQNITPEAEGEGCAQVVAFVLLFPCIVVILLAVFTR